MNQIVSNVVSCQNQIDSFFVNQRIALLLKQSNTAKKFGILPVDVMRFIFSLVFPPPRTRVKSQVVGLTVQPKGRRLPQYVSYTNHFMFYTS